MGKIIAFVPARGGSKSIPFKNIKLFCGKPLIYWSLEALQECEKISEIIVATDSPEIESVINSFSFNKVKIYHRSEANASDTASTESVMLEYFSVVKQNEDDVFLLVQATSPLIETKHLNEALNIYIQGHCDSMLTCVRNHRFFWNPEGTPINYCYNHRPRRQEFKGELMENGAFYINRIRNIIASRNRLSGKISIYEMPEYTAMEIDEPDDWIILENLMYKHKILKPSDQYKKIKLFLTDVDGVLTDGGMYYSESGDEMKKFDTRDGMAFELLRKAGIKTGIITSENTKIVENRARKMKANYLYQEASEKGKLNIAKEICKKEKINLYEVAYIGDDLNCYELLTSVGISACPSDAMEKIQNIPSIIKLSQKGGEGVVRAFVELLLK
jgi:N-acylneuraminate cytidylyltransferase